MGNTHFNIQYNVLLMGRVGNGKSSTGNVIAEKENYFKSFHASQVSRKNLSKCQVQRWGKMMTIIDTPGLADQELDEIEDAEFARNNMINSFKICPSGFNAFLLVLNYTNQYNSEEKRVIDTLTEIFGNKMFDSTILIFTHGDIFDKDQRVFEIESKDSQQEFMKWCFEVKGDLQNLLKKCGYRAVLFHNNEGHDKKRVAEMQTLNDIFEKLKHRYTLNHFNKNEPRRKALILSKYSLQLKIKITAELYKLKDDLRLITHQKETVHKKATELLSKLEGDNFPDHESLESAIIHLKENYKTSKNNTEKFIYLNTFQEDLNGPILQEIGTLINDIHKICTPEKHKNELKIKVVGLLKYIQAQSHGTDILHKEEERVKMFQAEVEDLDILGFNIASEIR